jgi:glyoxylase-like metal-dependent hydrolase (beta-lactamase superfamily II)
MMFKITRIQCSHGNCFCIEDGNNAILIDTSWAPYKEKIEKDCEGKNVRLIVLTHGHIDHIQNAAALSKALNAPIAMHKADYALTRNNMEEPMSANTLLGKIALASIQKSLRHDKAELFEPKVFLSDGDALDNYGVRATIIGLPGHTKGSIGILAGDSDLFVGDALMNIVYPARSLLYGNRADMIKSAQKISGFKSAIVHFGHGKSIDNRAW